MSFAQDRMDRLGLVRCPACPRTNPIIPADGNPNSPFIFIGEAPGKEENARGRPFIGKTGKEFNEHYLPLAGLTRDDIRITNVVKCFTTENSDSAKFQEMKRICSEFHLRREIQQQQPEFVVPMGAVACSLMPGDLNLDVHHGIPHQNITWWNYTAPCTFPMWHPAAGLHKTETMIPLRIDFLNFGKVIRNEIDAPVDEYPNPIYEDLSTANEVQGVLDAYQGRDDRTFMDTETDASGAFWCLTFSLEPGTGFMVRKANEGALRVYREWVLDNRRRKRKYIFHNGMFDLPVCEQVSITIPWEQFDDTMVRSYHLQYLPQGLKALAFRLCGMYMEEFEDVVLPYSVDVMMGYILKLAAVNWPKPEPYNILDKDGNTKLYRPQGLSTKTKRLITDFSKNPSHKVFKRWNEWSEEEKLPAIAQFGDMPRPSIEYVPLTKAIWYACRDADSTCRVFHKLVAEKRRIRKERVI